MVLRPGVGLRPTSPQQAAGARIEPKPSEPWAAGNIRAPTAAAAPPLAPPEMRVRSQGLRVAPWNCGSQVRLRPSSQVLVLPKMTSPARFSRLTCSLSSAGTASAKNLQARVVGTPARAAERSLLGDGTPINGPSGNPAVMAWRP